MNLRSLGLVLLLLAALSLALAQDGLDLPVPPPRHQASASPTPSDAVPPTAPLPDDDPRDTPPPTIYGEDLTTESDSIVYVIDLSSSMDGYAKEMITAAGNIKRGTRYERARAELLRSVAALAPNFRFNVVGYDCHTESVFDELRPATPMAKASVALWTRVICGRQDTFITRLAGGLFGGSTGTGPAAAVGLSWHDNLLVVLLTDGQPNCGAAGLAGHRAMISAANTQGATIDVFGIEATAHWRTFCQNVAGDSGGSYYDVP